MSGLSECWLTSKVVTGVAFLVKVRGGVCVISTHHPGEVGGVTRCVATAEAVPTAEGGPVALVQPCGVDLAQLEAVTCPGPVPRHLTRGPDTGHSRQHSGTEPSAVASNQVQTSIETH